MLETLRNAFKVKDIRDRIIFTFLMLILIRIGSQLPVPGVNTEIFSAWFAAQTANGMGFFDALTGGSFYNMSIFCIECFTIYYFINYYAASYHCNSKIGRDAKRR